MKNIIISLALFFGMLISGLVHASDQTGIELHDLRIRAVHGGG